jgi:hypothetical protein
MNETVMCHVECIIIESEWVCTTNTCSLLDRLYRWIDKETKNNKRILARVQNDTLCKDKESID